MPVNLEREIYETDGALALKAREYPKRPNLRLLDNSSDVNLTPSPNVISFTEFKLKKDQELLSQKLKLMPSTLSLRNLRREIISLTSSPKKPEIDILKAEPIKPEPTSEAKSHAEKPVIAGPDLLKGTGFTPFEEMNSLRNKYNEGIAKAEDPKQLLNRIVTENITNIRWYQWEYTMSDPILFNPTVHNDKKELVNSKSGYSIVEMTDDKEREGAVKLSVIRAQELLKDAKEGETVVILSPPKWTGRKNAEGVAIEYPEAELFTFRKGKGRDIRALTFISELSLEQCQEVSDYFVKPDSSVKSEELSEKEKIKKMVSNPILITDTNVRAENILDVIQFVKGGEIMRAANGANQTFAQAREFLARGDELQKLPDLCEEIIQTYEKYLRDNIEDINNSETFAAINQRLQLTVLEIAKILKPNKKDEDSKQVSYFYQQAMSSTNLIDQRIMQQNYDSQIAYLRTRPGCNGGANSGSTALSGSSLSEALSGGSVISSGGGIGANSSLFSEMCFVHQEQKCEGRCYRCNP